MTSICHLFDGFAGWEQRVGVLQLVEGLPPARFAQSLATIDQAAIGHLGPFNRSVETVARCGGFAPLAAPGVAWLVRRRPVDLIHAWGPKAAAAARAACRIPVILELSDPLLATRHVRLIRTLCGSKGFAVICSCEIVRRRLIEGGVVPETCVVIRPGVDFALIHRSRAGALRQQLGLTPDEYLITVSEPVAPEGGQSDAYLAAAILNYLDGGVRMIVPGASRERIRIKRFADSLIGESALVEADAPVAFEELVSICDALVVAGRGDVPTTSVAWAMAAETAVIGSAAPAIAELIGHKLNGLLFKQIPGKSMTSSIAGLLDDRESQARVKEVARGQAYQMFGIRRRIEQHVRAYENMLEAGRPGEDVVESSDRRSS